MLSEETIKKAFNEICAIELDDGIKFTLTSLGPIRNEDEYSGYRLAFQALYGKIRATLSMDISTGDIITPGATKHSFIDLINEESCELWAYPTETVLAEKIETILSRGTENTRLRDFYDVLTLSALEYDMDIFQKALEATAKHRNSIAAIKNYKTVIDELYKSPIMNSRWDLYINSMDYAAGINYCDTIRAVEKIMTTIE